MKRVSLLIRSAFLTALLLSCSTTENGSAPQSDIVLASKSVTPKLAKTTPGFESANIFSLVGSDDKLAGSPNFIFARPQWLRLPSTVLVPFT